MVSYHRTVFTKLDHVSVAEAGGFDQSPIDPEILVFRNRNGIVRVRPAQDSDFGPFYVGILPANEAKVSAFFQNGKYFIVVQTSLCAAT